MALILLRRLRFHPKASPSSALCLSHCARAFCSDLVPKAAGPLYCEGDAETFIPQVSAYEPNEQRRKRVLVLCTGGTLTMAPDPSRGGSLAPVQGALTEWMREMRELKQVLPAHHTQILRSAQLPLTPHALWLLHSRRCLM